MPNDDIFDKIGKKYKQLKAKWNELLPRGRVAIIIVALILLHILIWFITSPSINPKIGEQCFDGDRFMPKSYIVVDIKGDFVLAKDTDYPSLDPDWVAAKDLDACFPLKAAPKK
ncbi:MAG: hypothetical protein KAS32_05720 [Candidatus Peribacteraceae bacterium]|nr:hypothetical protein [Candidatus Peribacteraceae bacterium]